MSDTHTPTRATDERLAQIAALVAEPTPTATDFNDRLAALVLAVPELLDTVIVLQTVLDAVRVMADRHADDPAPSWIGVRAALDLADRT